MKHTKLIIAGLTAVITMTGASAVFAEDTGNEKTEGVFQIQDTVSGEQNESDETDQSGLLDGVKSGLLNGQKNQNRVQGMIRLEEIDMSGLELPEDFIPFDEAHVPDGLNIPKNGELKPIEFDEAGNMTYGQRPQFKEGERPELPEGGMPEFAEGERPELPEGGMPEFAEGERPELPDGGMQYGGQNTQMRMPF